MLEMKQCKYQQALSPEFIFPPQKTYYIENMKAEIWINTQIHQITTYSSVTVLKDLRY